MTTSFQDRMISMIVTVPNVKELTHSVENFNSSKPPSIPIYHGSIIHIEQHRDDQNQSDLIVRVPNFHHLSIPSVTISINDGETPRTKRRAPICPINKTNESEDLHLNHAKRLALGLRNLRRTIITNCKVKRSTNINQITIIPVLPDVEIIREEDFQVPTSEKKNHKISKFFTPKILFIKRKKYQVNKKRQPSTNSIDTQTDHEENKTNQSSRIPHEKNFSFINSDNQEQSTTILNPEVSDNDRIPETFISNAKIDLITDIEGELCIVHPDDDTYSECYEVTYEFDPEFQHFIDQHKKQIYLSEVQPSILEPFNYQDIPPTITPWLSILPPNDYEQIDQTQTPSLPRVRFQSVEDVSVDQPETISDQENNQLICLNDSSMINEDYTVILEFLKHALQIESIPDDDCNEFNKQIKELFRTDELDE